MARECWVTMQRATLDAGARGKHCSGERRAGRRVDQLQTSGLTLEVRRTQRHGALAAQCMMGNRVARPGRHAVACRLDRRVRRHLRRPRFFMNPA